MSVIAQFCGLRAKDTYHICKQIVLTKNFLYGSPQFFLIECQIAYTVITDIITVSILSVSSNKLTSTSLYISRDKLRNEQCSSTICLCVYWQQCAKFGQIISLHIEYVKRTTIAVRQTAEALPQTRDVIKKTQVTHSHNTDTFLSPCVNGQSQMNACMHVGTQFLLT